MVLVCFQLQAQVVEGGESDLITDLLHEGYLHVESVYILFKVEDMGFYRPCPVITYRRSETYVAHAVQAASQCVYPHKVYPIAGNELQWLIKLHIRRRETDGTADPVARNHNSLKGICISQHRLRMFHISLLKTLPYLGGADCITF